MQNHQITKRDLELKLVNDIDNDQVCMFLVLSWYCIHHVNEENQYCTIKEPRKSALTLYKVVGGVVYVCGKFVVAK